MSARAGRLVAVVGLFIVSSGAGVTSARADATGLSWADGGSSVALASGAGHKVTLAVRNDTGILLNAVITTSDPTRVTATPAALRLDPGTPGSITVSTTGRASSATSIALSVVVAPVPGFAAGAVLRRTVTLGPAAAPVPAVTSAHAVSRWGLWFDRSTTAVVPLASPAACALVDPDALKSLGYLTTDEGGRAVVGARCRDADGRAELRLSFTRPDGSDLLLFTGATYTGTLTFGDKAVAVTMRRTSSILWPVVAFVVGLALALWLVARRPLTLISGLRRRLRQVTAQIGTMTEPGSAMKLYRKRTGPAPWSGLDPFADSAAQQATVAAKISGLSQVKIFSLAPDDATYEGIDTELTQLEAGAAALVPLADSLAALAGATSVAEGAGYLTAWAARTRATLLSPATVTVGSLPTRKADAEAATALATAFQAIALQLGQMRARLDHLRAAELSEDQAKRVQDAWETFVAALTELQVAESSEDVAKVVADEVKAARIAVAKLSDIVTDRPIVGAGGPTGGLLGDDLDLPTGSAGPVPIESTSERSQNLLAVVLVAVLLVCAGLQALVIGKAFGTWWDFVQAAAWGAGSTTVAAPLVAAWETFAISRSGPRKGRDS